MTRISFLGPRGTFAEAALRTLAIAQGAELLPAASVHAALGMVRAGESDLALVPIENSVEGAVTLTLDELTNGSSLMIVDDAVLPVQFSLVAPDGVALTDIDRIATHPHAHAQVMGWLRANLPDAVVLPALSTAGAAAALLEVPRPFDAAIAQAIAAEIYGLTILADDIGDTKDATTRFVLVSKPGAMPDPTGADKTTLSLFMRADHPGALLAILTEFAVRGVNMTRIESRPTRRALGDYFFSVDIEGHVADARVAEALMGLHRICLDVRYLGSYPRHDGKAPVLRQGVTDADFAEATQWLGQLKGN
ncbi:MAG: prephenate dehydratase [Actinobacteria bacterium]|uniref:prephenate dehydratase n=1 Tax=freshwater metagenome TaxID=449393 RepID=A0A6J7JDX4_9ZZZZ|nr:prephenate dehydratase [Actinomycetota bacterium]